MHEIALSAGLLTSGVAHATAQIQSPEWATVAAIATITGVLAAILGIIIAIWAYFNYTQLENRIQAASKSVASEITERSQRELVAAVEAVTHWSFALSHDVEPEQLERTARHAMSLFPGFKGTLVTVAARYLLRVQQGDPIRLASSLSVQPRSAWREEVRHALNLLAEAGARPQESAAEVKYLIAKCYAMLREPTGALAALLEVTHTEPAGLRLLLGSDIKFFTGMDPNDMATVEQLFRAAYGEAIFPFTDEALMGHLGSLDRLQRAFLLARHPTAGYSVTLTVQCDHSATDPAQRWTLTVGQSVSALGWQVPYSTERFPGPEALINWLKENGYLVTALLDSSLEPLAEP